MFHRRLRLSRLAVQNVATDSAAKRLSSQHFSAVVSKRDAGIAVVVSKKVAKSAVARHLLKRQIRAAARLWYQSAYPVGVIIYAKPGSQELSFAGISAELTTLLHRFS